MHIIHFSNIYTNCKLIK